MAGKLLAAYTVQGTQTGIQLPGVVDMTPHYTHCSKIAVACFQERLLCRCAVRKVWVVFESGSFIKTCFYLSVHLCMFVGG